MAGCLKTAPPPKLKTLDSVLEKVAPQAKEADDDDELLAVARDNGDSDLEEMVAPVQAEIEPAVQQEGEAVAMSAQSPPPPAYESGSDGSSSGDED